MIQVRIRKVFAASAESAGFTLDVEMQAASGVSVLFGPSGAGKTLTLDAIAGFLRPDDGRILLDDAILYDGASRVHLAPQARRCGYVFQNYALFPHMTLRQNLEFAVESRPRLDRHRRVNEMIEKFRLEEVASRRPHELSGGQKQRCSVARALIGSPALLLLDEPAQGLDAPLRTELYEVLRQVRRDFQTPVLLVTHNLEECFELGEEMFVVSEGRIVQSGSPLRVLEQPATIGVAQLLGRFVLLPAEIRLLNPSNNTSRLRLGEHEVDGPYFPGRFKGDHVTLFVRPDRLRAVPRTRSERPGANHVPATLDRPMDTASGVRLEFSEGYRVEIDRAAFAAAGGIREWWVEFPAAELRVV